MTTNITGTIKGSGGDLLDGKLVYVLNYPIIDSGTIPKSYHILEPDEYIVSLGAVNLSLQESETAKVTYNFKFYLSDGAGGYETDPLFEFNAQIPNVASVEFTDLLPTDITPDILETSRYSIARILATTEEYAETLRGGPNPEGEFDVAVYYRLDDMVSYDGGSYVYVYPEPTAGNYPPNYPTLSNTYWQAVALRGNTGTGTDGNDTAYDPTAWDGQTDAPSRNAVRDVIETLATKTELADKASLSNPALTGTPTTSTPPAGDASSRIPTTQWVADSYAPINNPVFTGNVGVPTPPNGDISTKAANTVFVASVLPKRVLKVRRASNQALTNTADNTILWNTIDQNTNNAYNSATGIYTVPTTGSYRLEVVLPITHDGTSLGFHTSILIGTTEYKIGQGSSTAGNLIQNLVITWDFIAGDLVKVIVFPARTGGSFTRVDAGTVTKLAQLSIFKL